MILLLLLVLILLLAVGAAPTWPYSQNWQYGWGPSGFLIVLLVALVVLYALGMLPFGHLR